MWLVILLLYLLAGFGIAMYAVKNDEDKEFLNGDGSINWGKATGFVIFVMSAWIFVMTATLYEKAAAYMKRGSDV